MINKGQLDIAAARAAQNYSAREQVLRILWKFGRILFHWSPGPCFRWRCFVLRCFGAQVGPQVNLHPSCRIYFPWNLAIGDWSAIGEDVLIYNLGFVTIGQKVTISHGAHLCAGTHDYRRPDMPLLKRPIEIRDQAWVCSEAFVGPGVVVEAGAVVGARAVVRNNVEPWSIVAGNPATSIGSRELVPTA